MRKTVETPAGPVVLDDDVLAPFRVRLFEGATPTRTVFAAAHVVMRSSYAELGHSLAHSGDAAEIAEHVDWDATKAFRGHLDRHGFGIAEAMDTAQRFFLGWNGACRLIAECGGLGLKHGFCAGAGTDQLAAVGSKTDLVDGVVEQVEFIRSNGGIPVILPMPFLARTGATETDYVEVYTSLIDEVEGPLLLHWLGPMFMPELEGYFPGDSFSRILAHDPAKVRGCKLSNLDSAQEYRVRREILPRDQVVLTGDDFHFGRLIRGGDPDARMSRVPDVRWGELDGRPLAMGDFSHGLLGIFDGIAVSAGLALRNLADGDLDGYRAIMEPCEALGQLVFEEPTRHYKAGLAFLAWINGLQDTFYLVNHEQRHRSAEHLCRVAAQASPAGAILDAETAAERLAAFVADVDRSGWGPA